MKKDSEIQKDIKEELTWESRINGSDILVNVKNGFVTLSGTTDSYAKKMDAGKTAVKVSGVKDIFNEIEVKIPASYQRTDPEIEQAVLGTIKWNSAIDGSKIRISVQQAKVTLEGEVTWEYQKSRLENLVANLLGVREVTNLVRVVSGSATPHDIKEKIDAALKRNHHLNTGKIEVSVDGKKAILTGEVRSIGERSAAETAAWSAPGINEVENRLLVSFSELFI